jgi:hypothetical protein
VTLLELLDAAALSARQIASGTLGATDLQWSGVSSAAMPNDLWGVYIPLIVDGFAVQLGVLATRDVCTTLARLLLGGTEAPVDTDADLFDAIGEITNLVAGNFKVLLADKVSVRVGLPLAMKGRVFPIGGSQSIHGTLNVARGNVWLVMTGPRTR